MWKLWPESRDDSTEGNSRSGSGSGRSDVYVRFFCKGEASSGLLCKCG